MSVTRADVAMLRELSKGPDREDIMPNKLRKVVEFVGGPRDGERMSIFNDPEPVIYVLIADPPRPIFGVIPKVDPIIQTRKGKYQLRYPQDDRLVTKYYWGGEL